MTPTVSSSPYAQSCVTVVKLDVVLLPFECLSNACLDDPTPDFATVAVATLGSGLLNVAWIVVATVAWCRLRNFRPLTLGVACAKHWRNLRPTDSVLSHVLGAIHKFSTQRQTYKQNYAILCLSRRLTLTTVKIKKCLFVITTTSITSGIISLIVIFILNNTFNIVNALSAIICLWSI